MIRVIPLKSIASADSVDSSARELHERYGEAYRRGRAEAAQNEFCPTLRELRRLNFSDVEAHAFGRGFYHRCQETDPLNAVDRVADFVASVGGCASWR